MTFESLSQTFPIESFRYFDIIIIKATLTPPIGGNFVNTKFKKWQKQEKSQPHMTILKKYIYNFDNSINNFGHPKQQFWQPLKILLEILVNSFDNIWWHFENGLHFYFKKLKSAMTRRWNKMTKQNTMLRDEEP